MDIRKYPLVTDQIEYDELGVIIRELERVLDQGVLGDIVELGCYNGTTSLFITRLLQAKREKKSFHVYDSFVGLPEKTDEDASPAGEQFKVGELRASKQQFIKYFKQAGLPLPIIHKCWFQDLTSADMPAQIAFAFLDGDFYSSIKDSLHAIEKQLSPGAIIVVDDYQSEALPGARRAVDEWLRGKLFRIQSAHSLAVIYT